ESGVDLVSALESLARQASNDEVRQVVTTINQDVVAGKPFSIALERFEYIFGASYVASVNAGEASGKMWQVLKHLAQLRCNSFKLQQKLQTLLAYPIALVVVSGLVIAALVLGVLPRFAEIFETYGTSLPWITQVLIGTSGQFTDYFWVWIPVVSILFFSGYRFSWSRSGQRIVDHLVLNTYLLKDVTRALLIGRSTQLLGLLIQSGVPLLDSLRLVKKSTRNRLFSRIYAEMEESVLVGNGLGTALVDSPYVPPSAAEMLMTSEKTGTLGSVTQMVGRHYEEEGEEKLKKLIAYLEPAITVGMGVVVAAIVLAVALPMFDLATFAQ
ncbi:MAG: type II secretion system F family protein, partial [Planctomycetota bacterium]|nr:type II secretion system F family protein [Planctomycetota bacterium]